MSDQDLLNLISPEAQQFYRDHVNESIPELLLKHGRDPQKKAWVEQLDSRLRAKKKLPTWSRNEQVILPPKRNLQQASSEATALYKASLFNYKTSADLTGGTGVDSWAFAQRAELHTLIEPSPELIEVISHNFKELGIYNIRVLENTAEKFLAEHCDQVDLIYLDPSRRAESGKKVIRLEDYSPNVIQLQDRLLDYGKTVMIKVSPMVDLHYLKQTFKGCLAAMHIVAVQNEVKEVLAILQPNSTPFVRAIDLRVGQVVETTFEIGQDPENFVPASRIERYLYEPNAAVLKSGFFNVLCNMFGVKKLDRHSHLYTSEELKESFPGFTYRVIEVAAPFKLKTHMNRASVIARNFPQKPESIKKRLKLNEGDDYRIFATTLKGKKVFILGEPVRNK